MAASVYDQLQESVERFVKLLLEGSKTEDDLAEIKNLASYMTYFNNIKAINSTRERIFENFVKMIETADEKPDPDQVIREFQEKIEAAEKEINSSRQCEKYNNLVKLISKQTLNDSEIETVSEVVSTIDPISKLPIVDPVKNSKCGHIYDKSSILQLINQNPKTRCPIAGCNAAQFVKKSHLVPDNTFKRILDSANSHCSKN